MDKERPFKSHLIIKEYVSRSDFNAFYVGFDLNDEGNYEYRWNDFTSKLQEVIVEFAFGNHEEADNITALKKVIEAAKSIYSIKEFDEVRKLYDEGIFVRDDDINKDYLTRGEFGELILHLLLRDFHETVPLISKIYFKDSNGVTVHGFDAVHIQPNTKTLWLGESKIYVDSKSGIRALIKDIKEHFQRDYLNDEFTLISKKIKPYDNIPEKKYWVDLLSKESKLSDQLNSIRIPLLCIYSSDNFNRFNRETDPFISALGKEISDLESYFKEKNDHPLKSHLDIVLILFPVKCKNELVRRMHTRLFKLQRLDSDE